MFTYSLYDFFLALVSDAFGASLHAIASEHSDADLVPFISPDEIERRCQAVHSAIGHQSGAVSLGAVCEWQRLVSGLTVISGTAAAERPKEEFSDGSNSTLHQSLSFPTQWDYGGSASPLGTNQVI